MQKKADELVAKMTLDEKASLLSGADFWHLKGDERLGLPQILMTDGPHGLRKQKGASDHMDLAHSEPATCFPTASATASSWDVGLMKDIGHALAEECLAEGVSVILGPGVNIKRSPLCGRNFEYLSEDPYLSGELAVGLIQGIQALGVGVALKHFAGNNQEYRRMSIDSVIDERSLHEIYLPAFEKAVKSASPWMVMCAYNKLNGVYCSEHEWLLTELLREDWGFEGVVVTDWGACDDRVWGLAAGLDLEMPFPGKRNDAGLSLAIQTNSLKEPILDKAATRVVDLILKAVEGIRPDRGYDAAAHHELARRAARESMVLLKNSGGLLPLRRGARVALIGDFAEHPRYQGTGSSRVNPTCLDTARAELSAFAPDFVYARGYEKDGDAPNEGLLADAVAAAASAESVLLFVGLPEAYEIEGCDRNHLRLPASHEDLIEAVCRANPKTVVVLSNGSVVEMPWIDGPAAVLEGFLAGQAGAGAALDLIFGEACPSGKLAETYPVSLGDLPSTRYFPGGPLSVEYREGLYVGYRYFDAVEAKPLFPFGFGLSYTQFEYSDLSLSATSRKASEPLEVGVTVANTGSVAGAEIVQVYVRDVESAAYRPAKELKGFAKVFLKPGEKKKVSFKLDSRAFAYWNTDLGRWYVEAGDFEILVASSSADIRLRAGVHVESSDQRHKPVDRRKGIPSYYNPGLSIFSVPDEEYRRLYAKDLPPREMEANAAFDLNTPLVDLRSSFVGRLFFSAVLRASVKGDGADDDAATRTVMMLAVENMPLRALISLSGGKIGFGLVRCLLAVMNIGRRR